MKRVLNTWNRAVLAWGLNIYLVLALSVVLVTVAVYPVYAPFLEKLGHGISYVRDRMDAVLLNETIALFLYISCFYLVIWALMSLTTPFRGNSKKIVDLGVWLFFTVLLLTSSISWTDRAIAYYKSHDVKIPTKECKAEACQKQGLALQTSTAPPKSPWPFAKENRAGWERLTLSMGLMTTLTMASLGLLFFIKTVLDGVRQLKAFNPRGIGFRSVQALNQAKLSFKKYDQGLRASVEDKVLREQLRRKNAKEIENAPIRDAL